MKYINTGPDFEIPKTGKRYKHGVAYAESEVPGTNKEWFKPAEEPKEKWTWDKVETTAGTTSYEEDKE